jgi:hypothetical protein
MEQDRHESPRSEEAEAAAFSRFEGGNLALPAHPEERLSRACPELGRRDEDASRRAAVPARIGWIEGHMPETVEPLVPPEPETAFTQTRRLRHDGWTPEKMRLFLERFAECGLVAEACEAAGMSARAAYNLRDRDGLFAAGWDAAAVKARAPLADEAYSRARNGVVERIYRDGVVVAERHRAACPERLPLAGSRRDNRLTMAVLARLDARIDRAEAQGAPHLALTARWDHFLAALGEDRREDGMALLMTPADDPAPLSGNARERELRELHLPAKADIHEDPHSIWDDEDGWWTDYPPPPGFEGEEEGRYGEDYYRRSLSPAEQAVIDADVAKEEAEKAKADAVALAAAEALRDTNFGFSPPCGREGGAGEE